MQIQNNHRMTSSIIANSSQPNVGDVLQVTLKERVNNQDAVVSMKGTTSTITFEGKIPEQEKVSIEITGKTPEGTSVDALKGATTGIPSAARLARVSVCCVGKGAGSG